MEFPALRRLGSSAGGTHTSDHGAYQRADPATASPLYYGAGTPYAFLVRHDLRRCAPFGVFDVYATTAAAAGVHVGTQLSCPSYDDCWQLLQRYMHAQQAQSAAQKVSPTRTVLRGNR